MPMNFPDVASLKWAAEAHGFRELREDEPEIAFRTALADHVQSIDPVEAEEIRCGRGWDQWTPSDVAGMLGRSAFLPRKNVAQSERDRDRQHDGHDEEHFSR